jgi:hypothetical protein
MNGDVMMLKRLFQYQAHNKLLPALQVRSCTAMACTQAAKVAAECHWLLCCVQLMLHYSLLQRQRSVSTPGASWQGLQPSARCGQHRPVHNLLQAFLLPSQHHITVCLVLSYVHCCCCCILQTLLTETGEEMVDAKDDSTPMPLASYNVGNNSNIILRITVSRRCIVLVLQLEHVCTYHCSTYYSCFCASVHCEFFAYTFAS